MSNTEIFTLLKTLGYPVAYDHFDTKAKSIPFIVYRNDIPDLFVADDKVYEKQNSYIIDLVTEKKDITAENKVEKLLEDNYIPYSKTEDYISDEKIYQIEYSI